MERKNVTNEVEETLMNLFMKRLNIIIEDKDELLFGRKVGLSYRDLIYICFDIEKEFNISFDDDCVENYELTTFNFIKKFITSKYCECNKVS